jgi:hypothetical protein
MLTLPIRIHSGTLFRNDLAQWLRDIIAGSRDGLAMQDRYEALSRLSDWELAQRGLTRADFPRLVVTGECWTST